jgi:LuxR family maltose regulon positive regulatory protein
MQGLPEPLSPRELEILRLLPSGLTMEDIASQLIISVNTVRSHLKNIYAKLDVHSRHEAVSRANDLELL